MFFYVHVNILKKQCYNLFKNNEQNQQQDFSYFCQNHSFQANYFRFKHMSYVCNIKLDCLLITGRGVSRL